MSVEKKPSAAAVRAAHRVLYTKEYAPDPAAVLSAAKLIDAEFAPTLETIKAALASLGK